MRRDRSGPRQLQTVDNPKTVADGARTPSLGSLTFPLVLEHVSDMATVDDPTLLRTMFYLWERLKLVVEPTGALGAAAALEGTTSDPRRARRRHPQRRERRSRAGRALDGGALSLCGLLPSCPSRPSGPSCLSRPEPLPNVRRQRLAARCADRLRGVGDPQSCPGRTRGE